MSADDVAPTDPLDVDRQQPDRSVLVIHDLDEVRTIAVPRRGVLVVGRAPDCDVVVIDSTVSRRHARIYRRGLGMFVEDLDSRHGTQVDGTPIHRPTLVRPGSECTLGALSLVVASSLGGPSDLPQRGSRVPAMIGAERPPMADLLAAAERMAVTELPVLILGETGTGKGLLARHIHAWSGRRGGPLVTVNCGAIPDSLLDATLFGHERGAFTGAVKQRRGLFEQASGGTLLLDEIGELSERAQAALLRVLEVGAVRRVGAEGESPVDTRLLAATHRDLGAMAADGRFRQDLLYRLNVLSVELPPLRERRHDIEALARCFVEQARADVKRAGPIALGDAALRTLRAHPWPGNIRELRSATQFATVVAGGSTITPSDLPPAVQRGGQRDDDRSPAAEADGDDLRAQVAHYERQLIARALADNGGNQSAAARSLRMPRRTLVYKIRQHGLQGPG